MLVRYQQASNQLDVNETFAVWPTVDRKALTKAFDQIEEQHFDLQSCEITVSAARAGASCTGTALFVPKVGSKSTRVENREWRFALRKVGDAWLIESINARRTQ